MSKEYCNCNQSHISVKQLSILGTLQKLCTNLFAVDILLSKLKLLAAENSLKLSTYFCS